MPPERRIPWISKRLGRVAAILRTKQYAGATLARETAEEIREFIS